MDLAEWIKVGVELFGMSVIGTSAFFAVKGEVRVLATKYEIQNEVIKGIQAQVEKISQVIIDQKLIEQRAVNLDQRMSNMEMDIRLMKQGEGYILPPFKSPYER